MSIIMERREKILRLLRTNGYMTCEEILKAIREEYYYDVSIKTIRRDVDCLCVSYPISVEKGRYGGVRYCCFEENRKKRVKWQPEVYRMLYYYACQMQDPEEMEFWDAVLRMDTEKRFPCRQEILKDMEEGEDMFPLLLDVKGFAEYINISVAKAYELISDPECPYVIQADKKKVINRYLFDCWIEENTGLIDRKDDEQKG